MSETDADYIRRHLPPHGCNGVRGFFPVTQQRKGEKPHEVLVETCCPICAAATLLAQRDALLAAAKGMRKQARDILANDDPDGPDGLAAQTLLDSIAKAEEVTCQK